LYHNNLTRLVPIPQLTNTNSASQPLPSPLSNKVRLEYHVVYRIYSALLNTTPPQDLPGPSTLPSLQPPSQQLSPLFVSQEVIDQLAKLKDEPSKFPSMVPGHRASALSFSVPKKVDDAIKQFRYVNYSLLSSERRERAAKEEESLVMSGGHLQLASKTMHPADEDDINYLEWTVASKTVERRTLHFHGTTRTDALKAHHENVSAMAVRYTHWGQNCIYPEDTW